VTGLLGESCSRPIRSNALVIVRARRTIRNSIRRAVRHDHDLVGFDVPRDMRSSNSAHRSTRRDACSIRRAAVERNSLTSGRSSSDVGLVCATAFIMSHGDCKSEALRSPGFSHDHGRDILMILNLEDTPKHTAPLRLRDREA
jgi:hypothetical protein